MRFDAQVELCQQSIVPQLANTTQPGPGAPVEEVQAYIGYLTTLQANTATLLSCSLCVSCNSSMPDLLRGSQVETVPFSCCSHCCDSHLRADL